MRIHADVPDLAAMPHRTTMFGGLTISYDDRVLRPREWTVAQSLLAAHLLTSMPVGPVLELYAGAGQVGLLAVSHQPRPLVCVDVDATACRYARLNADAAGLGPLVEVRRATVEAGVLPHERFALVIADPPWVRHADLDRYPEDPRQAIDGGPDGLDHVWPSLDICVRHLIDGGAALVQLGDLEQARAVEQRLAADYPCLKVASVREPQGNGVVLHLEVVR